MGQGTLQGLSQADLPATIRRHANELRQVTSVSYADFLISIDQLNTLIRSFPASSGTRLTFSIAAGTDVTVFWKGTVRIVCEKVVGDRSKRVLNLREYVRLYNEVAQHASIVALQTTSPLAQPPNHDKMTASIIFDKLPCDGACAASTDECCICMDRSASVILSCAHSYCEPCIDHWSVTHKTCPVCRAAVTSRDDSWVLAERPDLDEVTLAVKVARRHILRLADSSGRPAQDVAVERAPPRVAVQRAHDVAVERSPSRVTVERAHDVAVERASPRVTVERASPRVTVERAHDVPVERMPLRITVDRAQDVAVEPASSRVTVELAQDAVVDLVQGVAACKTGSIAVDRAHSVAGGKTHGGVTVGKTHGGVAADRSHDVTVDGSRDVTGERSQGVAVDGSHDVTAEQSQDVTVDQSQDVVTDKSHDVMADRLQDVVTDRPQDVTADQLQHVTADQTHGVTADQSHDVMADGSQDVVADTPLDVMVDQS